MISVCIVEDERDLNQLMRVYLQKAGYEVTSCFTYAEAAAHIKENKTLWVIDIMLPDGSGLDLMNMLRQQCPCPSVIIVSAKGDRFDRVTGFELGCDDYIAKPFLPAELVFRVKRLLGQQASEEAEKKDIQSIGPYQIDLSRRLVLIHGEKAEITSREFDILLFFLRHKGQAVSREQLLKQVWSDEYFGSDRIVDNYIKNIRRKLPEILIETVYGYGYRYNQ